MILSESRIPNPESRNRLLAVALFVLLVVTGFRPELIRLLVPPHRLPPREGPASGLDRRPLRLRLDGSPVDLRSFLAMVQLQTPRGATIGVVLAPPHDGFSYAYWRSNYALAGRTVLLPPQVADIASADYIAVWQSDWTDPRFAPAWRGFGGALLERR